MKFFTLKNFHGMSHAWKWGFSCSLNYINVTKKPLPKYVTLLFFLSIGLVNTGDPLYQPKKFMFAFDILNFKQREGEQVRIHFAIPLKKKYETVRNVESV